MNIDNIFFELIQVAIGNRICLSHSPTAEEWKALYEIAKKQSLVGVCFAGVQRLQTQRQEPPEMLYLTWMGMAAKIQQRNETVNRQCAQLGERLKAEGYSYSILKGQGVGQVYPEHLRGLRQSGDIDVYAQGGMKAVMQWVRKYCPEAEGDYVHTHMNMFVDTDVEVHYKYGLLYNLWMNHKLQKWFDGQQEHEEIALGDGYICVPAPQFNALYLMLHTYRHLFAEGVGLRQIMDYYCFLKTHGSSIDKDVLLAQVKEFGMQRFAGALMWVMKTVFDCPDTLLVCQPNENEGRYLLDSVMAGGNFGHGNRKEGNRSHMKIMADMVKHSLHMSMHYGQEALWAPIWHVYHFFWKRTSGRV